MQKDEKCAGFKLEYVKKDDFFVMFCLMFCTFIFVMCNLYSAVSCASGICV